MSRDKTPDHGEDLVDGGLVLAQRELPWKSKSNEVQADPGNCQNLLFQVSDWLINKRPDFEIQKAKQLKIQEQDIDLHLP